jgi:hypothetical protein
MRSRLKTRLNETHGRSEQTFPLPIIKVDMEDVSLDPPRGHYDLTRHCLLISYAMTSWTQEVFTDHAMLVYKLNVETCCLIAIAQAHVQLSCHCSTQV